MPTGRKERNHMHPVLKIFTIGKPDCLCNIDNRLVHVTKINRNHRKTIFRILDNNKIKEGEFGVII